MYLDEVAEKMNLDPVEAAIEIEKAGGASLASFNMSDEDVYNFIIQPFVMISSDGQISDPNNRNNHPRSFGNWPRALSRFVRDTGLLTWEEAIKKMTSMPANQLGLFDRGIIREGIAADIVIFCPATVKEKATYLNPTEFPEGIPYVLVNGRIVIDKGEYTGVRSGIVLYGRGRK